MTNTSIDFRTLPLNVPSLCIPRVFPNITEARIRGIFTSLDMGEIAQVDIVTKKTAKGDKFNQVFIHFRRWNTGENADKARERLLNGKEIKIIYDDPWFWKISAFREREKKPFRPSDNFKPVIRKPAPPRLQFDEDTQDNTKTDKRQKYNQGKKENDKKLHQPLPTSPTLPIDDEEKYHDAFIQKEEIHPNYGKNLPQFKRLTLKPKKIIIKSDKEEEV